MFRIIDILQDFTDRQTGARSIMVEGIADTASDLPQNTAQLIYIIGSYADVIDTGDRYKINSAGQWILQPRQNAFDNVYTKSEIDALLQAKQNTLIYDAQSTRDSANMLTSGGVWLSVWSQVLGVNTTKNLSQDIPAGGYDLNTIIETGIYRIPSASVAGQIAHVPQQAAARLIVSNVALDNRYMQFWFGSGARFFIRSYISTGWQHWHEYAGTDTGA